MDKRIKKNRLNTFKAPTDTHRDQPFPYEQCAKEPEESSR